MDVTAIRVVEGAIPEITALLEQKWDKIFYTGNGKVGRIVMAAAAKHLTPVVLELGGKSPVVVDSNINLKVAVRRITAGKWGCNNGQACISPDYIITTKENVPKLLDAMKHELEKFYGKDPLKSGDMSRIKDRSYNSLDVPADSLIMKEEILGPLLPILTVNKVEESIQFINAREKPLAAYLFTGNKKLEEEFVRNISAGGLLINDTTLHLATSTLPFGGVEESGMGSYNGRFSFEAFSHKKAVLRRSFGGDVPARYPPYTPEKVRYLKTLLNGNILGLIRALLGW